MKLTAGQKKVLAAIFNNGCRFGDDLTDLRDATGFSVQALAAVAKIVDGKNLKTRSGRRFRVDYFPRQSDSFQSSAPGIKNPRSGVSAAIPAQIAVTVFA